jgi:hypothetical protein
MDRNPMSDVIYYNNMASPSIYLKHTGWSFVVSDLTHSDPDTNFIQRIDVTPVMANESVAIALDTTIEVFNYFLPQCPNGITGVKGYSYVVYPEIFESIDLFFLSNPNWYKMYYVVKPGGNPEDIALLFEGADTIVTTLSDSSLAFTSAAGAFVQPRLDAYSMETSGELSNLNWKPNYTVSISGDTVGLTDFGIYDDTKSLVFEMDIEVEMPAAPNQNNNVWSTYIGTSGVFEMGRDVETDEEGNLYFVGGVSTSEFPINLDVVQTIFASLNYPGNEGVRDALICKFSPTGVRLISTYYGGWFDDIGSDIEIDAPLGRLVMLGQTQSDDYPTSIGAYRPTSISSPLADAVLTVLNLALNEVAWSTYYGGWDEDGISGSGEHLALDDDSNIYLCLSRISDGMQTIPLSGAYNQSTSNTTAGLLAQFNSDGVPIWSSLFTGILNSIEFNQDKLYVVGNATRNADATSCGPPTTGGFPLCDNGGFFQAYRSFPIDGQDGFLSRFNQDKQLDWSTFIGGAALNDLAIQGRNLYLVGSSLDDGDPANSVYPCSEPSAGYCIACDGNGITGTEFTLSNAGNSDMLLAKIDLLDSKLLWATQYGGEGYESATNVEIDNDGRIYIGGYSNHSSFPTVPYGSYYYQDNCGGDCGTNGKQDPVVMMIQGYSIDWATFYGGASEVTPSFGWEQESIFGITTYSNSRLYITGITSSPFFPYRCESDLYPDQYCRTPTVSNELQDGFITLFKTDGSTTVDVSNLSLDESNPTNCIVYPNPTTGRITLQANFKIANEININVVDIIGRTVFQKSFTGSGDKTEIELDVQALDNGMYTIEAIETNQRITCRFIKQ